MKENTKILGFTVGNKPSYKLKFNNTNTFAGQRPDLKRFSDGEQTILISSKLFEYDFDTNEMPSIQEFVKCLNTCNIFVDGIKERLKRLGYAAADLNNKKELRKIVSALFSEAGIEFSASVKNWITKDNITPSYDERGRRNVYKLCFALKMDNTETAEFFLKSYLDRPFNPKVFEEAVYLFCLRNGKTYSDALNLIDIITKSTHEGNENIYTELTTHIEEEILNTETDAALIKYIIENRTAFERINNQTGCEEVKKLLNECCKLAKANSIDAFLKELYEHDPRKSVKQKKKVEYDNVFPKYITTNFPQRQQFEIILKAKNPSYESIRKALIILNFYHFFSTVGENTNDILDEFEADMDALLERCGYVQFYKRNPFDLMIYYCAMSPEPIDRLKDFIYYITVEDANKW